MSLWDVILGRKDLPGAKSDPLSQLPTQDELLEAQRREHGYQALRNSHGWELVRADILQAVSEAMDKWVAGGLSHVESERLAAQVDALRWILQLPERGIATARVLLQEVEELKTTFDPDDLLPDKGDDF